VIAVLFKTECDHIHFINPKSVMNHFHNTTENPWKNSYSRKKKLSVEIAQKLIDSNALKISDELKDEFRKQKKKDDLADSLLLNVAFVEYF
jgi:hypothetical protein